MVKSPTIKEEVEDHAPTFPATSTASTLQYHVALLNADVTE